jgi:excisionase family DNA binding protein
MRSTTARTANAANDPVIELTSVKEMARTLGISTKLAYRLLNQRVIESRYLGRRRLVSRASLNAFIEALPESRD